jgi:hypothetical protein
MNEQSKHPPAKWFTLRRIQCGAHSTEKGQSMSSSLTKRDSHWIGGVVTMAAVLGAVIGLGTESYLWGGIVTLVVGACMVAVIAMME